MRKLIKIALAGVLMTGVCVGLSGCSEETGEKIQTKITTPGGTATRTDETRIKQSGDNPPPPPPKNP
jgi:hypothetical protein